MGGPPMRFSVYYLCHLFKRYSSVNFEDDHNLMGCSLDQNEFTSQSSGLFNGLEAFGDAPPPADVDHFWLQNILPFVQILLFFWRQKAKKYATASEARILGDFISHFWRTSSPDLLPGRRPWIPLGDLPRSGDLGDISTPDPLTLPPVS